ncbi:MAG: thiamine phosphate synthase [Bryobacteraceae bacterium]
MPDGFLLPRFYPILDTEAAAKRNVEPEAAARALLDAGVKILQFRHKGHFSREIFAAAERIAELCRKSGALLVIDDRADIAALLDAGLHVGQDDLAPADARRVIGGGRVLGYSTHNEAQLRAGTAEPADYLAIGPIFTTGSKRDPDPVVGLMELRRLRPLVERPLAAIGGITLTNAAAVLAAGADTVAVISDLYPGPPQTLRQRAEEWIATCRRDYNREA